MTLYSFTLSPRQSKYGLFGAPTAIAVNLPSAANAWLVPANDERRSVVSMFTTRVHFFSSESRRCEPESNAREVSAAAGASDRATATNQMAASPTVRQWCFRVTPTDADADAAAADIRFLYS